MASPAFEAGRPQQPQPQQELCSRADCRRARVGKQWATRLTRGSVRRVHSKWCGPEQQLRRPVGGGQRSHLRHAVGPCTDLQDALNHLVIQVCQLDGGVDREAARLALLQPQRSVVLIGGSLGPSLRWLVPKGVWGSIPHGCHRAPRGQWLTQGKANLEVHVGWRPAVTVTKSAALPTG